MRRIGWVVVVIVLLLAAGAGLLVTAVARADRPITRTVNAPTRLGPFLELSADQQVVYAEQTIRTWERIGLKLVNISAFDWLYGQEYTYRPWVNGWPRETWALTPGQRFADWWVRWCAFGNCEGEQDWAAVQRDVAQRFDEALAASTAR